MEAFSAKPSAGADAEAPAGFAIAETAAAASAGGVLAATTQGLPFVPVGANGADADVGAVTAPTKEAPSTAVVAADAPPRDAPPGTAAALIAAKAPAGTAAETSAGIAIAPAPAGTEQMTAKAMQMAEATGSQNLKVKIMKRPAGVTAIVPVQKKRLQVTLRLHSNLRRMGSATFSKQRNSKRCGMCCRRRSQRFAIGPVSFQRGRCGQQGRKL